MDQDHLLRDPKPRLHRWKRFAMEEGKLKGEGKKDRKNLRKGDGEKKLNNNFTSMINKLLL